MTQSSQLRFLAFASVVALSACARSSTSPSRGTPPAGPVQIQPAQALPVRIATEAPAPAVNPFEGADFYVNPDYQAKLDETIEAHPDHAGAIEKILGAPTALWLDRIEALERVPGWLDDAQAQSAERGRPVVPVFVVYDLPNRDCAAKASAGELKLEEGGELRYREEFIDPLAEYFAAHPEQRVVAIIEPDSLPNLVSNLGVPKCALSQEVYKNSIAYAISKLSLPNVFLYLDAAHAGWLGWEGNRVRTADLFVEVLAMAGGTDRVRGFATNVSNYNPLEGDDGRQLEESNPCPNELLYIQALSETLHQRGFGSPGFIVDTSRNGQGGIRSRWGNWCNIRGAGLGERPQVSPEQQVDAFYWVKPPGESDGVADASADRFDENCRSHDATSGAPEAGQWFESYFLELVENANPPL